MGKKEDKKGERSKEMMQYEEGGPILNFCNHFWGKDEKGYNVLLNRMDEAKSICEEIRVFYKDWATIEEEYSRRLRRLVRGTLGSHEIGTMRESLDVLQKETEMIAKQHSNIALQIRGELEEPLHAFSSDMRSNRKAIQSNLEKLRRIKMAQETQVQKCKEKVEDKSNKTGGQGSQLTLFSGKNSDKNNSKIDKAQIIAQNNNDYLLAVTVLQETTIKWVREWKIACDKFQDLEERRLSFIKSTLWTFSGIISTTCISDSKSCEKIRASIEKCNTQNDIQLFIRTRGTGQEIPNPPKSKDPCGGGFQDIDEPAYSIAQFSRASDPQLHSDAIMQRSILNENNLCLSPKISSFLSNGQTEQTSKTYANDAPLDGITQFCKNDSLSNSSNTKSFSPTTSMYPHDITVQTAPLFGLKDHSERDSSGTSKIRGKDGNFFNQNDKRSGFALSLEEAVNEMAKNGSRSTSPVKNFNSKKNTETVKSSLLERLKGMGIVSDSENESIDPRANVMLNVGNNVFKVESDIKKQKPELQSPEDPIVSALSQFKVSSKVSPLSKKEPSRVTWDDSIDDNDVRSLEMMGGRQCYSIDQSQKLPLNLRSSMPVPQRPNLPMSNKFVKQDCLDAPPSAITATKMKHITQAYTKQMNEIYSTSEKNAYPSQYTMASMNNQDFCYDQAQENMFAAKQMLPIAKERIQNGRPRVPENIRLPMASGKPSMDHRHVLPTSSPQPEYRTISPEYDYPRSGSRSPIPCKSISPGAYYAPRPERPMETFQDNRIPRSLTPRPIIGNSDQHYDRVSRQHPPISPVFDIALDSNGNVVNKYSRARSASPCPGTHRAIPKNRYNYNVHMEHQPYSSSIPNGYGDYYHEDVRAFNFPLLHNDRRAYMNNDPVPSQYTEDGKRILFYVRALYDYQATIPEEISFIKDDILLVLEMQEDGWWEGEVVNSKNPKRGLFPSNFVQRTTVIS